ncbi:MAG TPA: pantoate--beta-alanine ligase [Methylovirgula sp.]
MTVEIARDVASLRAFVMNWHAAGTRVALVPTMGALHEGHLSLVADAKRRADRVVMSIFVNPAQFAPNEDFAAYPRTIQTDVEAFIAAGGDLVFAPEIGEVYPPDFVTKISLGGPATAGLEDKFRPDHFTGVATVVAKLLIMAKPDVALFGEKDYQQLAVIRQMARDLNLESEIVGVQTVRAKDGLALSSRNVYLTPEERARAPLLHGALERCRKAILAGEEIAVAIARAEGALTMMDFAVDYVAACHAVTLAPVTSAADRPIRLLAAARLGATRLIDNIAV